MIRILPPLLNAPAWTPSICLHALTHERYSSTLLGLLVAALDALSERIASSAAAIVCGHAHDARAAVLALRHVVHRPASASARAQQDATPEAFATDRLVASF